MNFESWLKTLPVEFTGDPLWKIEAYRLSLFLADLAWRDVTKLTENRRMFGLADQLYRAVGSVSANISEGYSRGSGKDRARFYEYALGSARESRGWFYNGRHVLGENVADHRVCLCTQIVRFLLTMVPDQRSVSLHEDAVPYVCSLENLTDADQEPPDLLKYVPLADITHHASRITQSDTKNV